MKSRRPVNSDVGCLNLKMKILLILGLIGLVVIVFFFALAALLPQRPHDLTREDVANEIDKFLKAEGGHFDWDDFCTFRIVNPELDRIRQRCANLDEEFPPGSTGPRYCNEQGIEVLKGYLEDLRRPTA